MHIQSYSVGQSEGRGCGALYLPRLEHILEVQERSVGRLLAVLDHRGVAAQAQTNNPGGSS